MSKQQVLILGASYGSLLGTKAALAGHDVTLVCTASTAELINREGTWVRFPVKGDPQCAEVHSADLPGTIRATTPDAVEPGDFDLVVLGMQEAHYGAEGVRELTCAIAHSGTPCLAIMNMPPPPFLSRIEGLPVERLRHCYAHHELWRDFEPGRVTLASPDPQAYRPVGEPKNVLEVGLPTNFKTAAFEYEEHTAEGEVSIATAVN